MGNLVRVCRDDSYKTCPGLAESWEANTDFTQWTFKLRDNLVWHDGVPFDAQSAKDTLDLLVFGYGKRPPHIEARNWGEIASVEALSSNRVRINLKSSTPGYLQLLGISYNLFAFAPHRFKPEIDKGNVDINNLQLGVVGTGPFKLKEYQKGSLIAVRKFDRYWEKDDAGRQLPYLEGIDFVIFNDQEAAMAAFRVGRVDYMGRSIRTNALSQHVDALRKQFGDKVGFIVMLAGGGGVRFNTVAPGPFQDVRVRKAVQMVYDQNAYMETFFPGYPPKPIFLPGSPLANPDFMTWPGYNRATQEQDLAQAKRLMAEAGYPNGFKTSFLGRAGWALNAEFAVQQMSKIGIQADVTILDMATITDRNCKGSFEVSFSGAPDLVLHAPWAGAAEFGSIQSGGCPTVTHNDTRVDELFSRMARFSDAADQAPLAREVERLILLDQVYFIPNSYVGQFAYRAYVRGLLHPMLSRVHYMDNAWVWLDK